MIIPHSRSSPWPARVPCSFSRDTALAEAGYVLGFSAESVSLSYAGQTGLTLRADHSGADGSGRALEAPERFAFPQSGTIADAPRYGWRGCHLDVSRQVYGIAAVTRFVDILAWNKMNVLHWHLSDDEGWRLEIKARPELTRAGARQGPNEKMLPQLGTGAAGSGGFYTQDEVRALIAHAGRLGVDIMPEFDIPGHCAAVLAAYPELADPDERPGNYHSVQGYANNSLNPAVPAVLRPSCRHFHRGRRAVPVPVCAYRRRRGGAWFLARFAHGPAADGGGKPVRQPWNCRPTCSEKVQDMLSGLGKKLSGWDEVSYGGGVVPDGALLMAWQKIEVGPELAEQGYDVVMCPGQAYYLDMAQATGLARTGPDLGRHRFAAIHL